MKFKWKCHNCQTEYEEDVPDADYKDSELFEIEEYVMDRANEHMSYCLDADTFIQLIGIKQSEEEDVN